MPQPHPLIRQNTHIPQHALSLLSKDASWTNHKTPQLIKQIPLNLIAAHEYKPIRTQAALERDKTHQTFQPIMFICYTFC